MAEGGRVLSVLDEYQCFLVELDTWFHSMRVKYGSRMQCGRGCTLCCCGLFDVRPPDALTVAVGFHRLSPSIRNDCARRASTIHSELLKEAPELKEPFFLDGIPEDRIDSLADCFGSVRCPFLDIDDVCLIYAYRPSACILEGVPMADVHDGLFDDWCELNFTGGIDQAIEADLRQDYYKIEATIGRITKNLVAQIPAFSHTEATVFIPSIVTSFESFWKGLVNEQQPWL